jgi:hypothetical protein
MRIEPQIQPPDKYKDLSVLQKRTRMAAIIVAFCGVFVWVVKILLF